MDMTAVAGMVFSLLLALIVGGFILTFPLTKRLGKLLEMRLEERRVGALPTEEAEELRRLVSELQGQVARLAERQEWSERLLEHGRESSTAPRP